MFIRNAWYVAAWDHEILGDSIVERVLLGDSVILYRKADGSPVVLENRCCHRAAPLALGRKEGDCIRCMYHGLKFAPNGECIEIPGQSQIPSQAKVRSYPAIQRTRWVWLTPETATSTHYFFSHAHNFALDDPLVTEATYQSINAAFDEDSRMIEAQARIVATDPAREMLGIRADSALVRYRRMVRAALDAECT